MDSIFEAIVNGYMSDEGGINPYNPGRHPFHPLGSNGQNLTAADVMPRIPPNATAEAIGSLGLKDAHLLGQPPPVDQGLGQGIRPSSSVAAAAAAAAATFGASDLPSILKMPEVGASGNSEMSS